jgi:hypothetical protein
LVRPLGVVVDHEHAHQVPLVAHRDVVQVLGLPTLKQAEKPADLLLRPRHRPAQPH